MLADQALRATVCGLLLLSCAVAAEDQDEPDLAFLEYLGMWEDSDEEWQLFDETVAAENAERSDPAPEGEESTEKEDES